MRNFIIFILTALLLCGCDADVSVADDVNESISSESEIRDESESLPEIPYYDDLVWAELEILPLEDGYLDEIDIITEDEWRTGEIDREVGEMIVEYDGFSALIKLDHETEQHLLYEYCCDGKVIRLTEPVDAWLMLYTNAGDIHVIEKGSPSGWYSENDSKTTVILYGDKAWYCSFNPTAVGYDLHFSESDGELGFSIANKAFEVQDLSGFVNAYESPEQLYSISGTVSVSENGIELLPQEYLTAEEWYQNLKTLYPDSYSAPTYAEFVEQYKTDNP